MKAMKKQLLLGLILLALGTGVFLQGCAYHVVYVRKAPPPARVEVRPPKPFPNAVWIAGHWHWNGVTFVWISGRWVKPRPGYVWVPGHWMRTHHGWRWVPGRWKRVRG
jgi:hypothetical protein